MSRCDWGFQDVISQSDDSASSVQTCIFNYLFYGVDNKKSSGRYVVYDIGGGTFDVSVLDFHEGISKELSKLANSLIIKHFFYKLIKKGRCVCAYYKLDKPLDIIVKKMQKTGVLVDTEYLGQHNLSK